MKKTLFLYWCLNSLSIWYLGKCHGELAGIATAYEIKHQAIGIDDTDSE